VRVVGLVVVWGGEGTGVNDVVLWDGGWAEDGGLGLGARVARDGGEDGGFGAAGGRVPVGWVEGAGDAFGGADY
jgi:hypothetical protein